MVTHVGRCRAGPRPDVVVILNSRLKLPSGWMYPLFALRGRIRTALLELGKENERLPSVTFVLRSCGKQLNQLPQTHEKSM